MTLEHPLSVFLSALHPMNLLSALPAQTVASLLALLAPQAFSFPQTVVVQDDFGDSSLDEAKWDVVLPFSDSSLVEGPGQVSLFGRPWLLVDSGVTGLASDLVVEGRYDTYGGSALTGDEMVLVIYSDASLGSDGQALEGIRAYLRFSGVYPSDASCGVESLSDELLVPPVVAQIPKYAGYYGFRLEVRAGVITFTVRDSDGGLLAELTTLFQKQGQLPGTRIGLYNRRITFQGGGFTSYLDELSVSNFDCNNNGVPDAEDLSTGAPDCNGNGILDSCDIAAGTSTDLDDNGVPDECAPSLLAAQPATLDSQAGGTQFFSLTAGPDSKLDLYFLLGSMSGTSPGVPIGNLTLPLNIFDPYFDFTLEQPNSTTLVNTFGVLDIQGTATASVNLPSSSQFPSLAGLTLHHAYVVLGDDLGVSVVSNPVELQLLP